MSTSNLIKPIRIYRQQIRETAATHIYIYGTDRHNQSYKGQCAECIGEPNAFPIYTKWRNCDAQDAFFYDSQFIGQVQPMLDKYCFYPIHKAQTEKLRSLVVFPRLGLGCSNLSNKSPWAYDYIMEFFRKLFQQELT